MNLTIFEIPVCVESNLDKKLKKIYVLWFQETRRILCWWRLGEMSKDPAEEDLLGFEKEVVFGETKMKKKFWTAKGVNERRSMKR